MLPEGLLGEAERDPPSFPLFLSLRGHFSRSQWRPPGRVGRLRPIPHERHSGRGAGDRPRSRKTPTKNQEGRTPKELGGRERPRPEGGDRGAAGANGQRGETTRC